MMLGTSDASLLGNLLAGKEVIQAGEQKIRAKKFLVPLHVLTFFEIQKYYQNKPKFKDVYLMGHT